MKLKRFHNERLTEDQDESVVQDLTEDGLDSVISVTRKPFEELEATLERVTSKSPTNQKLKIQEKNDGMVRLKNKSPSPRDTKLQK